MARTREEIEQAIADQRAIAGANDASADAIRRASDQIVILQRELRALSGDAGDATSALDALSTAGASNLGETLAGLSKTASEAREGIDAYYTSLTQLSEFQAKKDVFVNLLETFGTNYQFQIDEFSLSAENFGLQIGGLVDDMFNQFMNTDLPLYFGTFDEFAGYASQVYNAVGSGYAAMRDMGEDASRQIQSSALMARGLGFTATEMMDAMDAQFSRSGEFSNDILREITTYSNSIAEVTGDSNKVIARGILAITTDFETFANVSVQTAAETMGGLRSIGLEVKDLASITNKFMNFDTAAESLANLNTVFGMQLDTMGMMEAASRDPFEAMMMLRESFISTGQDFENLTLQQKNLLAQQAGLDVEAAARLFDPDRVVANMDELTAATEEQAERGVLSTTEALDSLAGAMGRIPELGASFSDTVMNRMAMRDLSALANSAIVADAELTEFAATAQTRVPEAVAGMLGAEEGQLGADVLTMVGNVSDAVVNGMAGLNNGIATEMNALGRGVPNELFVGLSDPESQAEFQRSGLYVSEQIQEGTVPIEIEANVRAPEGGGAGVEPAGDLYVPSVGGPAFSLDDPGDEVIIGRPGGAVTRAIGAMGLDILDQYASAVEPDTTAVDFLNEEALAQIRGELGVSPEERRQELARRERDRDRMPDRFQPVPGGAAVEHPPINLNLTVKMGGETITDLKDLLIKAPDAGGVDFVREVVT